MLISPLARSAALCALLLCACEVKVLDADQFAAADSDAAAGEDAAVETADGEVAGDGAPTDTASAPCPAGCDDLNPCTVDECTGPGQCAHTPSAGGACDDGNACTVGDSCAAGGCVAGKPKDCTSEDPCLVSKCDPTQAGKCKLTEADDGTACNDQSACSESDKCKGGACKGTPLACKDDNPCTTDACDAVKGCVFAKADGKPCDDDNPCTLGDACSDGACKEGKAKECISPDPCYSSKCSLATGGCKLTEIAEGEGCNDGNQCTEKDVCKGGNCKGAVIGCDDKNPCTSDSCDAKAGCVAAPAAGPCDDLNPCTTKDACANGQCAGAPAEASATCDDANPCTADGCDPKSGCTHGAASGPCNDGNPCTDGDACKQGKCTAGANTCSCQVDADCAKEEDGDLCNGTLYCDKSEASPKCKVLEKSVVVCDAKANTPCSIAKCDAKSGKCAAVAAAEGKACDADGSVCTQFDSCAAGLCKPGAVLQCDDKNPCTTDACDSAKGCAFTANTAACDADGDACTAGDKCQDKVCLAGGKKVCDDNEVCTADSCDPKTGSCVFAGGGQEGQACNADSSACTDGDKCTAGKCTAGPLKNCNDNNACTTDSCDAKAGCQNVPSTAPCDDGNACTSGDQCAQGKCSGSAVNVAVLCDDKNGCTTDTCDPAKGCAYANNTAACEDGNVCTTGDVCASGKCVAGASQCSCQSDTDCPDDGNKCNGTPYCDKAAPPFACKTKPGTPVSCSTANDTACAVNSCDAPTGKCNMQATNNSKACDDGSACTTGETCTAGACKPAAAVACDDNQICTTDACDPKVGCTYVANTAACTDNNACTVGDACKTGSCFAGTQVTCDDKNACTTDLCDKTTGCKSTANTSPCNDGSACTANEFCSGGKCGSGNAVACNDGNPCTSDGCDPASGCFATGHPDGSLCTDNNPCTAGDGCKSAMCQTTGPTVCDDKNACTNDTCDASKGGCQYAPKAGAPCEDGDKCTGNSAAPDACSAQGQCTPGAKVVCNDGNPCTDDICTPSAGCTSAPNVVPCDDGQPCTLQDKCSNGKCAGTPGAPDVDGDGYKTAACSGGNDCNDNDKLVNPGAKEDCATPADDNCINGTNEQNAQNCTAFAFDGDGDGFGQQSASGAWNSQCWCLPPTGTAFSASTAKKSDCDDGNKAVNPGATEDCATPQDDDCNGIANSVGAKNCQQFYQDNDSDGYYAVGAASQCQCSAGNGYTGVKPGDCDDKNADASPDRPEDCKTPFDDDCNGSINGKDATGCTTYFLDGDQDGFYSGAAGNTQSQCWCAPSGKYSAKASFSGDCDDANWGKAPNQPEVCDGQDNNCSGAADENCDDDGDGHCDATKPMTADALCKESIKPGEFGAGDLGRVLIMAGASATSSLPSSLRTMINRHYVFEGVDIRYVTAGNGLPSLNDLRRWSTVVLVNDGSAAYEDPAALGDLLHAFVQEGGGLLLYGQFPQAGYVVAGALATAGLPLTGNGTVANDGLTLSTGSTSSPTGSALCQDGNSPTSSLVGGDSLGTLKYTFGVSLAANWTGHAWVSVGGALPFLAHRQLGLGRIVVINALSVNAIAKMNQIPRTAARWLTRGWGTDCNDDDAMFRPGSVYDTGCNGKDEDCSGFDNCSTVCSPIDDIDAASGWEEFTADADPDTAVPNIGSGAPVGTNTAWKATGWADANFVSTKQLGMCFGQPDEPAATTKLPEYPDTGTKWYVARKSFNVATASTKLEFRYRYLPDAFENVGSTDRYAIRLDTTALKLLDVNPTTKPVSGGWHTKSVPLGVALSPGAHTIYLFFRTGDGKFNNGAGAVFDQFRTCTQ
ncbi:MAG: putative metal-binding motif-containing protein [Deltaproteobacteria bacterium]|nr:putative metal-binding motif-containing protein [Deltaproteobacteria bacterium]